MSEYRSSSSRRTSAAELRPRRPATTSSLQRPTTLSWWSRMYAAIRPWLVSMSMGAHSYAFGGLVLMYRPTVHPSGQPGRAVLTAGLIGCWIVPAERVWRHAPAIREYDS